MAPQIRKPAPYFEGIAVVNGELKPIKLTDYRGKYLVLLFYPYDFQIVCPTDLVAFSEASERFKKLDCELIAVSTDSHYSHLAWINTPHEDGGLGELKIPLLADKSAKIAKAYELYSEETGIPFRGLFIIDDKQNVRHITMNDLPIGCSADETYRLVQAIRFTDKHGEAFLANWQPSGTSMKPSGTPMKANPA